MEVIIIMMREVLDCKQSWPITGYYHSVHLKGIRKHQFPGQGLNEVLWINLDMLLWYMTGW